MDKDTKGQGAEVNFSKSHTILRVRTKIIDIWLSIWLPAPTLPNKTTESQDFRVIQNIRMHLVHQFSNTRLNDRTILQSQFDSTFLTLLRYVGLVSLDFRLLRK